MKYLLIALLAYFLVDAAVILFQRRLIYFPHKDYAETPADRNLPFEETDITAEDGVRLRLWHVPAAAKGSPAILFFHGNGENLGDGVGRAAQFRESGYSFTCADYRGYGRSYGTPTEEGLYRDAEAAYRWLVARGVPAGRIILYGHSLGAGVASWLATREPVAGLVLEGAFPSVHTSARHHYFMLVIPESQIRDRYPTAENVAGARCPVLVIHAERDGIAPLKFGKEVFARAREPKFLCIVPKEGHNTVMPHTPAVRGALADFRKFCLER